MFQTVFNTTDLPRNDRLALFDQAQTSSDHPMRAFSNDAGHFSARIESLDLAAANVVKLTCSPTGIIRTGRQVRDFDPELYSVVLPGSGCLFLEQADQQAVLEKGSLALYSSSQPFRVQIDAPGDTATLLRVHAPKALFQLPPSRLDQMLAQPVPGTSGAGALLTGFLAQLSADAANYTPADMSRLGNLLVDLMTATMAHYLDVQVPGAVAESTLMPQITTFIKKNLNDPDLSPPAIAAVHHISVSYLHRLFRAHDTTVGTWIRGQRLEHARRDLRDPHLRTVPIHRIAARWGFGDHATFTRAFRDRFGMPPREYRGAAEWPPEALTG